MFRQVLTITIALTLTFSSVGCGRGEHPKDAKMIENFGAHRSKFEELLKMFEADRSLGRVGPDFTRNASFFEKCVGPNAWDGKVTLVAEERLAAYRQLFKELGLTAGIEGYCDKIEVLFYASTRGLSVSGSMKGYSNLKVRPEVVVESLDTYWSADGRSFTAYKQIDGNWYLYFNYED